MKNRLSKLQKRILITLFEQSKSSGIYVESASVKKDDTKRIKELEKDGYVFSRELRLSSTNELSGLLRYEKTVPNYKMQRSGLISKIYNWQQYNKYNETCGFWERKTGTYWAFDNGKGFLAEVQPPPQYHKKQATFTRSLQLLAGDKLVSLLDRYDELINLYSKTASERLKTEYKGFDLEKAKADGLEKYKEQYKKLQEEGHFDRPSMTFDWWFTLRRPITIFGMQTGGWNTPESVYRSNFYHRNGRNISKVRLTPLGVAKVKVLLKVKSRIPLPKLTLRPPISVGENLTI